MVAPWGVVDAQGSCTSFISSSSELEELPSCVWWKVVVLCLVVISCSMVPKGEEGASSAQDYNFINEAVNVRCNMGIKQVVSRYIHWNVIEHIFVKMFTNFPRTCILVAPSVSDIPMFLSQNSMFLSFHSGTTTGLKSITCEKSFPVGSNEKSASSSSSVFHWKLKVLEIVRTFGQYHITYHSCLQNIQ